MPLVTAELAGLVTHVAVAVGLASVGIGANAVAWGWVVDAVALAAVIVGVSRPPSRPDFDLVIARHLLRFGFPLALSAAIFEGVMNVDFPIVGRELAGASPGVCLLAFSQANWPVSIVSGAMGRVSFAGYSALRHDRDRLARGIPPLHGGRTVGDDSAGARSRARTRSRVGRLRVGLGGCRRPGATGRWPPVVPSW